MEPSSISVKTSASAVMSLLFGILAWGLLVRTVVLNPEMLDYMDDIQTGTTFVRLLLPSLCGLGAIVLAHRARTLICHNPAFRGRQMALAGLMLGWSVIIPVILMVLWTIIQVLMVMYFFLKLFG